MHVKNVIIQQKINMILRVIKKAINNFSFSQKGTFFTSLMNLRTFITKSDATFKYNNILTNENKNR